MLRKVLPLIPMNGFSTVVLACLFLELAQAQPTIDFGDNMHPSANNGICSDARFTGPKAQRSGVSRDQTHQDAADCRTLYEAGEIECFSRRRCAAESLESKYRRLDVRGSLLEDRSNGLAAAERAMIYVEPQGTRGDLEFTAIDGTPVRNKKIVLFSPGFHKLQVKWLSPTPSLGGDTRRGETFEHSLANSLRFTGTLEFDINLEAGRFYRIYPARIFVSDASLVEWPITPMDPGIRRVSEGAEGLAIWVVDAETDEVLIDQRQVSARP